MTNRPTDIETLQLVKAFFGVADLETRQTILALVQAAADGRPISMDAIRLFIAAEKQH